MPHSTKQTRAQKRLRRIYRLEALETRHLLTADVLITEILADNEQGIDDEDGDSSDWIEIFNAGDTAADLNGWYLTDSNVPTKWQFPAVSLAPNEYMVIHASGKDRRDPDAALHTNFRLSSDGEYLGLVEPDGVTIASEFKDAFPKQFADVSYGVAQEKITLPLVGPESTLSYFVPTAENGGDQLGTTWTDVGFDDSAWKDGLNGLGFEINSGFADDIHTDVSEDLLNVNTSLYARIPFEINNANAVFSLSLQMKYDDGFVAYLNGSPIAARNAPDELSWNAEATTSHRNTEARVFEMVDLFAGPELLQEGANVLAIHGLNQRIRSNDFLLLVDFTAQTPGQITDRSPGFLASPSPGLANGTEKFLGVVENPVLSVSRGFFDAPQNLTITVPTPGSRIITTTDGSTPTLENGNQFPVAGEDQSPTADLAIDKTTTLRVTAVKDGFLNAKTATHTYVFPEDVVRQDYQFMLDAGYPEMWGRRAEADYGMDPRVVGPDDQYDGEFAGQIVDALKAAPTVSIVMNRDDLFGEEGLYINSTRSGFEWERPTSVEFIYPEAAENIQADAGIRIQGDNVRNLDNSKKQSFRLEFREQYGPTKLRFPIFGEDATDRFDTVVLRGQYNDGWVHTPRSTQYIRDHWARQTQLAMGQTAGHGTFMHVYLNGIYWGVYNAVERPEESFASTYYGGDKDEWDILNTGAVRNGNSRAWSELRSIARDANTDDQAESNAAFLRLLGKSPDGNDDPNIEALLDVEHYIDYLLVNFYGGNTDWPHRNYYAARQRGPDSTGFKFHSWDAEKILDHGEGSTLSTNQINVREGAAAAYSSLRSNDEFRLMFADRVHQHFFNHGVFYVDPDNPAWDPEHPERNVPASRYHEIAQQVELPLVAESARWGDTQSNSTRNDGRVYTLHDWRSKRDNLFERYFPRRSEIVLNQLIDAGLYPAVAAPVFNQHGGAVGNDFELTLQADNEIYYTIDGSDPRQSSLAPGVAEAGISPNAIKFENPIRLETGTLVKARSVNADGQWSALNQATFSIGTSPLRITELMYHPTDSDGDGDFEEDDFEFVELTNTSTTESIDLDGVQFTDGIGFVFGDQTLNAGERVVIARNAAAFQARYGETISLAGEYGATEQDYRLSNAGETIRLEDAVGNLIQEFSYSDEWHTSTDGRGASLTIVDPLAELDAWSTADGWRPSLRENGSPGFPDAIDFNGDNVTNALDIDLLCQATHRDLDPTFDLNADGLVDRADLEFLVSGVLQTTAGDVDLDGQFDSGDLVHLFAAGEYEDDVENNSGWSEGDFNCDQDFTSRDLVDVFQATTINAAVFSTSASILVRSQVAAALDGIIAEAELEDDSTQANEQRDSPRRKHLLTTDTVIASLFG